MGQLCVAVLYTSALAAEGLRLLLSQNGQLAMHYIPLWLPDAVQRAADLGAAVVILEAPLAARVEEAVLAKLDRGVLVRMSLEATTMSFYRVQRGIPATIQELTRVIEDTSLLSLTAVPQGESPVAGG